jgi:CRP/FNR family transcriptional regulator
MTVHSRVPEGRKPDIRCANCPIQDRAVCAYAGPQDLALLEAIKSYRTYLPGEEIVAAGEPVRQLGSVITGAVALSRLLADGRKQMVGLLFPGDFVGRALAATAPFDAVAVGEVTLCLFDKRRFERILGETPELRRRLLEMTLDELDAARDWMVVLGRKTAREKLASFLLTVARRTARPRDPGKDGGTRISLPLTREATADYLGLTIETVSRQIGGLQKAGILRLLDTRTVLIPDLAALREASGGEG